MIQYINYFIQKKELKREYNKNKLYCAAASSVITAGASCSETFE